MSYYSVKEMSIMKKVTTLLFVIVFLFACTNESSSNQTEFKYPEFHYTSLGVFDDTAYGGEWIDENGYHLALTYIDEKTQQLMTKNSTDVVLVKYSYADLINLQDKIDSYLMGIMNRSYVDQSKNKVTLEIHQDYYPTFQIIEALNPLFFATQDIIEIIFVDHYIYFVEE